MAKRIFSDSERQVVDDLLNKHGLAPKDIADKWDTSTCVVYKQLRRWGVTWKDNRGGNFKPKGKNIKPAKALKIIEVGERTRWPAERIALHCGTSISYTKQVLTKGLSEHYTKRGINLKDAETRISRVRKMMQEGASRMQAVLSVGWSLYKYKYWLQEMKKAPQ